jgi:hypothetical protein
VWKGIALPRSFALVSSRPSGTWEERPMKKKPTPNLIDLMNTEFRPWFEGESWNGWKSVIKAISALPMSDQDQHCLGDCGSRSRVLRAGYIRQFAIAVPS